MIGLSRFRTAVVKDPFMKVAYVEQHDAIEIQKTGVLHLDPEFLGTGCIMEEEDGIYVLKVVGSFVDNVLTQDHMRRDRAYRWLSYKLAELPFNDKSVDARLEELLKQRYHEGMYPTIEVLTLESVTEQIFEDDVSDTPPQGEYQPHSFVTILNYPVYDKQGVYVKDEYIALVTDL